LDPFCQWKTETHEYYTGSRIFGTKGSSWMKQSSRI
jgi:hypothetical protein